MRALFFLFPALTLSALDLSTAATEIVQVGVFLNQSKLCPATSGNFSCRLDDDLIAITASGKHKGELTQDDVLVIDLEGNVQNSTKKSSAETPLHTLLYKLSPDISAVLHTHSTSGIILSRLLDTDDFLITENYEIHKAFPNITTHESKLIIPIFENSQNIEALAEKVSSYIQNYPHTFGFLIRGHGFYTWGKNMKEARYRIEAFEQLFECELSLKIRNK